ncbi:MAG: N-formylglutamate deformylase [Burkholderiales bacterium]|nr:N-formylglutamate deformylase [Burkholderiales bacterium]MDE2454486.1 N-formylglutamate deformylase [Burkholderiales bacterium]
MSEVYRIARGRLPLLVSIPHVGTEIPPDIGAALVPRAAQTEDADWHLERLYAFAAEMGASLLVPRYARYVVDLNRPPENTPMYPGQNNTELLPTRFFTGEPLYRAGAEPDAAEVERRVARYWMPYHEALAAELARLKSEHGHALLFEGHSIQAELPWLFAGHLPDLNVGTVNGGSVLPGLRERLAAVLADQTDFSHVIDGRFKGGYITRRYGRPDEGVQALQMEMCWHCYMAPWHEYDEKRAARVQPLLRRLMQTMLDGRA